MADPAPPASDETAEALYREAQDDNDRIDTLADWDDLPADEALDEP